MKIAINGLGRIGRRLAKNILEDNHIQLVAINDIMPIEQAVYFLKYDSTYGMSKFHIEYRENIILIEHTKIQYSQCANISELPWKDLHIDIAVNCSGTNKSKPQLTQYLELGIQKVILSSPPESEDIPIIIRNYNSDMIESYDILSNASCTTYCVAPLIDIFHRHYEIEFVHFSTIHCYTSDQNLQDAYHPDLRRARAAGVNIIPTTTSATKVIKTIFPELKDKISGSSFRVPVINGSITEFIFEIKQATEKNPILETIENEIKTKYQDVISITNDKIVSSDVIACPYAALIDIHSIEVIKNKVKLTAFYDNEAGYSYQLMKLISEIPLV